MKSKLTSNLLNTLLLTFVLLTSTNAYADPETVDIDQGTYMVFKTEKASRFDLYKGHTYVAFLMKWNGTDPIAVIPSTGGQARCVITQVLTPRALSNSIILT